MFTGGAGKGGKALLKTGRGGSGSFEGKDGRGGRGLGVGKEGRGRGLTAGSAPVG